MRRMLLYALAILVALLTGLLAFVFFAWTDWGGGLGFVSLGFGLVWGLCWVARRVPAMRRVHFRAAAFLVLASAIALAVVFPSVMYCGLSPGRPRGIHEPPGGGCRIDHLMTIRLAIIVVGIAAAWALAVLGSRRVSPERSDRVLAPL